MKTKIIYISGSEVFEMSQVRAAFEEIRQTLGLDKKTVLFGVPVDSDDALADKNTVNTDIESQHVPVQPIITDEIITKTEPIIPVKKSRKSKKIVEEIELTVPEQIIEEITSVTEEVIPVAEEFIPIVEEIAPVIEENTQEKQQNDETIIPILSILATNDSGDTNIQDTEPVKEIIIDEADEQPVAIEIQQTTVETSDDDEVFISDIKIETEFDESDNALTKQIITDMLNDEAPISESEKTIEQLLESMAPLSEDFDNASQPEEDLSDFSFDISEEDDDDDATLAQLASEFAKNEDKIIVDNKPETHGKIGKLKNILPFKKVKSQDTSLMGDLFGWAGIAANDEDFSMPGFFTPNASRKQGS